MNFKSKLERENALLRTISSIENKSIPKKEIEIDSKLIKCPMCSNLISLDKLDEGVFCPKCASVVNEKKHFENQLELTNELIIWLDGFTTSRLGTIINEKHKKALILAHNRLMDEFKRIK